MIACLFWLLQMLCKEESNPETCLGSMPLKQDESMIITFDEVLKLNKSMSIIFFLTSSMPSPFSPEIFKSI